MAKLTTIEEDFAKIGLLDEAKVDAGKPSGQKRFDRKVRTYATTDPLRTSAEKRKEAFPRSAKAKTYGRGGTGETEKPENPRQQIRHLNKFNKRVGTSFQGEAPKRTRERKASRRVKENLDLRQLVDVLREDCGCGGPDKSDIKKDIGLDRKVLASLKKDIKLDTKLLKKESIAQLRASIGEATVTINRKTGQKNVYLSDTDTAKRQTRQGLPSRTAPKVPGAKTDKPGALQASLQKWKGSNPGKTPTRLPGAYRTPK